MPINGYEIVSLGVDWITATTKHADTTLRMLDWASKQITVEMQRGNERCWWAMSGFEGHKCGQVQVGFRNDEGIVRLSSDYARDRWRDLYDLADNVSRLDLQVTSKNNVPAAKRVHQDWRKAKRVSSKKEKGAEVTIISKLRGGDTFYSGSPQSDKYGRCYDKFAQSKREYYRECVRHEVQYNSKLAMLIARDIANNGPSLDRIPRHISGFWANRLGRFRVLHDCHLRLCRSRPSSDVEKRLAWLSKSVRPSIQSLVECGHSAEVLRSLGISIDTRGNLVVENVVQLQEEELN